MAAYAQLGLDNVVLSVIYMDTIQCMTRGGIEKEEIGLEHLQKHHGHLTWKKCSYNTRGGVHYDPETGEPDGGVALRANYPGTGWYYSSEHDIFYPPQPYPSWTLNTTTGLWEPPIVRPEEPGEGPLRPYYVWDEAAYQEDNTTGWVLTDPPTPPSHFSE